jgi:hypothetical protein
MPLKSLTTYCRYLTVVKKTRHIRVQNLYPLTRSLREVCDWAGTMT